MVDKSDCQLDRPIKNLVKEYRGYWDIVISNNGNKSAEDVVLELPISGTAMYENGGRRIMDCINHTVNIGVVRPGSSVQLAIWTDNSSLFSQLFSREAKLLHKDGCEKVNISTPAYGLLGYIAEFSGEAPLFVKLVLLIVVIFLLLAVIIELYENPHLRNRYLKLRSKMK